MQGANETEFMSDLVHLAKIDGIAVITINNPPVNEGARLLEEGIALRAEDVDIIYLNGYGFPEHRGGPMWYADTIGLKKVYERIREFQQRLGNWWEPAPLLQRHRRARQNLRTTHQPAKAPLPETAKPSCPSSSKAIPGCNQCISACAPRTPAAHEKSIDAKT
jgi:3-hydroxyacyl-CoA dehydrogenase